MRSLHQILTAMPLLLNLFMCTIAQSSERAQPSLYQARGLIAGRCYENQIAAISCRENCTATLFPGTASPLILKVQNSGDRLKRQPGHFFRVDFKIHTLTQDQISLIRWVPVDVSEVRRSLRAVTGLVHPVDCALFKP